MDFSGLNAKIAHHLSILPEFMICRRWKNNGKYKAKSPYRYCITLKKSRNHYFLQNLSFTVPLFDKKDEQSQIQKFKCTLVRAIRYYINIVLDDGKFMLDKFKQFEENKNKNKDEDEDDKDEDDKDEDDKDEDDKDENEDEDEYDDEDEGEESFFEQYIKDYKTINELLIIWDIKNIKQYVKYQDLIKQYTKYQNIIKAILSNLENNKVPKKDE